MSKTYKASQAFDEGAPIAIELTPFKSSNIKAIGYDEATQTLAVTFVAGLGALHQYPNVSKDLAADFVSADSVGIFFGKHIKDLPFKKYRAETAAA